MNVVIIIIAIVVIIDKGMEENKILRPEKIYIF